MCGWAFFRTGAIHVHDQILAINGETLEGRPLSEAIRMLQLTSDAVTLKITRPIDPPSTFVINFPYVKLRRTMKPSTSRVFCV